jgi:hypothetical protein
MFFLPDSVLTSERESDPYGTGTHIGPSFENVPVPDPSATKF